MINSDHKLTVAKIIRNHTVAKMSNKGVIHLTFLNSTVIFEDFYIQ